MTSLFRYIIPVFTLIFASQAYAWTYSCGPQKISHKTLNRLTATTAYGNFVTLRMSVDGQAMSVPTLLPASGQNTFDSHDGDISVMINPLIDESGFMTIYLKIKSRRIKGSLVCRQDN